VRDFQIDGIVPIIPTPFFADEKPDWESLQGLIEFAYAGGSCAICLPAYASEFYKLSEDERREAIATAVKYAGCRIPVIAQINFATPHMIIETAAAAIRGILQNAFVRQANLEIGEDEARHIDVLNSKVLASLDQLNLPRNPLLVGSHHGK